MDFGLTEEQQMIVDTTRSFVENELYPHEAEVERTGHDQRLVGHQPHHHAADAGDGVGRARQREQADGDLAQQAVARAVWEQRVLQLRYDGWKQVTAPVVRPLGLVLKAGVWYLVALPDEGREREPRTYRLASILSATVLARGFTPPKGFDLARHWRAVSALIPPSTSR